MERWRAVVGYEGTYEVSDLGRVRSAKTKKLKALTITKTDPRPYLGLWKHNRQEIARPHRLVLEAFVGERPEGMEGCHNDGNPANNRLSNLRWDTPKNNHADKVRHGTTNRGERCGTAKLTAKQVASIRADTRLQRVIAAEYGILQNHVSRIKSGVRWAHD